MKRPPAPKPRTVAERRELRKGTPNKDLPVQCRCKIRTDDFLRETRANDPRAFDGSEWGVNLEPNYSLSNAPAPKPRAVAGRGERKTLAYHTRNRAYDLLESLMRHWRNRSNTLPPRVAASLGVATVAAAVWRCRREFRAITRPRIASRNHRRPFEPPVDHPELWEDCA